MFPTFPTFPTLYVIDFDSTIITKESLDEYAKYVGKEQEIATITNLGMNGGMSFRESFMKRLEKLNITPQSLNNFIEYAYTPMFSEGFLDFIYRVTERGDKIVIVSGGIRQLIEPAIKSISHLVSEIHCNELDFPQHGEVGVTVRFTHLMSPKGKCLVVEELMEKYPDHSIVMIGDGATDLETQEVQGVKFIGYGGNVIRPKVKSEAKYFVESWNDIQ